MAAALIEARTPFGRPVAWAHVAMITDIGDSHELNDDRCLVLACRDLGGSTPKRANEFLLCLLADGATGSTFSLGAQAGWRASQLAQAAFLERFLASAEIDVLDQLKDGLRAADRALVDSPEGSLSSTLTALYLASDGTAYAASIGDSVLLVLPPGHRTPADRRLKKLGYEDTTAVGSGDTTLSYVDEAELIEQWWPNKENDTGDMRVRPGTFFVLLSDGISDNLPVEFIEQLVQHHTLDQAAVGLARHTRERRAQMQRSSGGSTHQLGLDNMSAIAVRFDGSRQVARTPVPRLEDACLFALIGTHGGPQPASGGNFGLIGLASQQDGTSHLGTFARNWLESEHQAAPFERLSTAFVTSMEHNRFAALARDEAGGLHPFSAGLPELTALFDVGIEERSVEAAHDSALQRLRYRPRLWASGLAALALFLLVSTAFATGTVRPAPPPAPTSVPGEPTATPDTRPQLSLGGFLLVGPPPPATPTPTPTPAVEVLGVQIDPAPTEVPAQPAPRTPPRNQPARVACNNLFGIGCPSSPAPPAGPVIPVASPGASTAPSASNLEDALQIASLADRRFERGLAPGPTATP
jgi:serine/threonine protein phosphatase PrpC